MTRFFVTFAICVYLNVSLAAVSDPLRDLLVPHPSWMAKTVTSHDFWGGNGDGQFFGGKSENYRGQTYKVLFHERGEGLIQRFLISALPDDIKNDFQSLVILIDGREAYNGGLSEFFAGRGRWQHPLVYDISQSSGSYVSYVPFPYKSEAKILMRMNPHFYQVTYREGAGSSAALSAEDLRRFMTTSWWGSTNIPLRQVSVGPGRAAILASGPTLLTWLKIRLEDFSQLKRLSLAIGNQTPVPLAFLFGLGVTGYESDQGLRTVQAPVESALTRVDPAGLLLNSRQPIPLKAGEQLRLISTDDDFVEVGTLTDFPVANVRFNGQYRDQQGSGKETTMTLFESTSALNLATTVMEITDAPAGSQLYLEGEEMIRVDGLAAPVQLGTGTEEYFGGGWYFWNVFSNFFSGLPRRTPSVVTGDAKTVQFEHSLYRQHVIDPQIARMGLRFGFEAGETGAFTPVRYRTYVTAYEFENLKPMWKTKVRIPATDKIKTFADGEREQNSQPRDLFYRFIAEGKSTFKIDCPPTRPEAMLLTRTYDGGRIDQMGTVEISKREVGVFFNGYANTARRFAQDQLWIKLDPDDCDDNDVINVTIKAENWTESDYDVTFF